MLVFAWILLDTEQASSAAKSLWNLISPFVAGAVIAFVFNVPMRAIERQLDGIHKEGLRRVLSIVLTIAALALVIMFVVEMLAPQIQVTVAALTERIPTFIEQTSAKLVKLMDDNPDMKAWIMDIANLESLEWTKILKDSMGLSGQPDVHGDGQRGECDRQRDQRHRESGGQHRPLPFTVWRGRKFWRGRGGESSIP